MTLTGFDAAYPPATPPQTDVVAFYGGGDTPHVWTLAQINAQTARYRLPIFVRSNPYQASALTDAQNFMAWLRSIGCPSGVATVLDLETAVAAAYVSAFASQMHAAGYLVLPYGSSSTLYRNPVCDGYFVALPGARAIPSNCVAVQYGQGGSGAWDLDLFSAAIPMWDTRPPPPGPVPTQYPEDDMQSVTIQVAIANGEGWCPIPAGITAAQVVSVMATDIDPASIGQYASLPACAGVTSDNRLVFGPGPGDTAGAINGNYGFILWAVSDPATTV